MAADAAALTAASAPSAGTPGRAATGRLAWGLYVAIFILGAGWSASLMVRSPGTPVQDEIAHVLIAKQAWSHPTTLLHAWGRPVNTALYAIPSRWGLNGARVASLVIACATVLVLTHLARSLGLRWLFLVPLFLWFQPWFADLSHYAITEVPFAFLLVLALAFAVTDRDRGASITFGLLPLVRHEGIALTGAWCLYRLIRRKPGDIGLSIAPMLAYEALHQIFLHRSAIAAVYFSARPTTIYGSGGWGHFLPAVLDGIGPAVLALGALAFLRGRRAPGTGGNARGEAMVGIVFILYFGLHTVLYRFGLYASGGYALFLLPLAPGAALAAALGAERFVAAAGTIRVASARVARAVAVVLLAVAAVAAIGATFSVPPRPLDREAVATKAAAAWLRAHGDPRSGILATHAWFFHFYDYPMPLEPPGDEKHPVDLNLPRGTIVIWDKHFSNRWGVTYARLHASGSGWEQLASFQSNTVIVFRRIAA